MGICAIIFALAACHSEQQQGATEDAGPVTKVQPASSSALFNARMDSVMVTYYRLKDAFFATDTGLADQVVWQLKAAVDSLPLDLIRQDSARYNKAHIAVASMQGEIAGLAGENSVKNKQAEFSMISDIMYDLVKSAGMSHQTVYRQFCPMALDNQGGYWLSNKAEILNPYYGKKMPDCGETKETLQF